MKNRKREREQRLTWRSPPSPPARPSPLARASHPPPLARRTRGAWPAPAATRRPPPASADARTPSTSATQTPWTPRPLHSPPASPLSLSLPKQGEAVAAVCRHRDHRAPLASLTRPKAPPRRPRPLRRATPPRTPPNVITAVVFYLEQPRSPATPRRRPTSPEPAETRSATAVSSSTEPPSSLLRLLAVDAAPLLTVARRRASSTPASLRWPFGQARVLNALTAPRSASLVRPFPR